MASIFTRLEKAGRACPSRRRLVRNLQFVFQHQPLQTQARSAAVSECKSPECQAPEQVIEYTGLFTPHGSTTHIPYPQHPVSHPYFHTHIHTPYSHPIHTRFTPCSHPYSQIHDFQFFDSKRLGQIRDKEIGHWQFNHSLLKVVPTFPQVQLV